MGGQSWRRQKGMIESNTGGTFTKEKSTRKKNTDQECEASHGGVSSKSRFLHHIATLIHQKRVDLSGDSVTNLRLHNSCIMANLEPAKSSFLPGFANISRAIGSKLIHVHLPLYCSFTPHFFRDQNYPNRPVIHSTYDILIVNM